MINQATRSVPREDLGVAFHEYDPSAEGFIANEALPPSPVGKKAATMGVITRENLKRADSTHANGAAFGRVTLISEDKSYACVDHGLEGQLTDEDRATYETDYDAEYETVQSVTRKMYIEREIRVAAAMFNTTTWDSSDADLYTNNSASPWDTAGTGIIGQVRAAKEKVRANTGVPADSMIIGEATMNNMLNNTEIKAKFPGATVITEAMLRGQMGAILGIQNLLVGQACYNTADEGQDASMGDVWPDDYAMVAALGTEGMPMTEPQLGRTILWEQYIADIEYVESYREEQNKSDIIRVEQSIDEKVFDKYFGHLMLIDA